MPIIIFVKDIYHVTRIIYIYQNIGNCFLKQVKNIKIRIWLIFDWCIKFDMVGDT